MCIVLQLCSLCVAEAYKKKITYTGLRMNDWLALEFGGLFGVVCDFAYGECRSGEVHHGPSESPAARSLQP